MERLLATRPDRVTTWLRVGARSMLLSLRSRAHSPHRVSQWLSIGSATISVPAGPLALGSDTLTATYTPDSNSSLIYNGASGSATLSVKTTPTVTVTPGLSSITTVQSLSVTVAVNGGTGNPTPTGSVILTGGSYTSSAATLSSGSATIAVATRGPMPGIWVSSVCRVRLALRLRW